MGQAHLSVALLCMIVAPPVAAQKLAGIAAGMVVPVGELGRIDNVGYAAAGVWQSIPPLASVGFRVDASYNAMKRKATIQAVGERVGSLSAGAVIRFPRISVSYGYAIATVGTYAHWTSPQPVGATTSVDLGYGAGAGYRFAVGGRKAFAEARYHKISSGARFIPVTFGLAF